MTNLLEVYLVKYINQQPWEYVCANRIKDAL